MHHISHVHQSPLYTIYRMLVSVLDERFHKSKPNITSRLETGINKPVGIVRKMEYASICKTLVLHEKVSEQMDAFLTLATL